MQSTVVQQVERRVEVPVREQIVQTVDRRVEVPPGPVGIRLFSLAQPLGVAIGSPSGLSIGRYCSEQPDQFFSQCITWELIVSKYFRCRCAHAHTTSARTRPGPVERIQVLEVAVDRVVAVEKFIDREVPVMVEKVEVVDRRVEVPVTHERVVQVPVEATALVAQGARVRGEPFFFLQIVVFLSEVSFLFFTFNYPLDSLHVI